SDSSAPRCCSVIRLSRAGGILLSPTHLLYPSEGSGETAILRAFADNQPDTLTTEQKQNTLWGGRFSESTDQFVQEFTASVNFDRRMYAQDIRGSIAHATMLSEVGVLSDSERDAIVNGLNEIRDEIERGEF